MCDASKSCLGSMCDVSSTCLSIRSAMPVSFNWKPEKAVSMHCRYGDDIGCLTCSFIANRQCISACLTVKKLANILRNLISFSGEQLCQVSLPQRSNLCECAQQL